MKEFIRIEHLDKSFGENLILDNINLSFTQGTVTTIIGPSGSGKSTLLRCINQLEEVSSGHIYFHDDDLTSRKTNLNSVRSKIGMVFQNFNLFDNLTVLENCTVGPVKVLKERRLDANNKAFEYLHKVGMKEFYNRKVSTLSGGQKQRVAIARTLCMNPEVILFDEPTSSLDPEMVYEVLEVIKSIVSSDISFIIVTHEMDFAKEVSDRIIFMADGIIQVDGSVAEIFEQSNNERLIQFIRRYKEN